MICGINFGFKTYALLIIYNKALMTNYYSYCYGYLCRKFSIFKMDNMETATIRPGALSLVLQTARIVGVAPLGFKKLRDGYSISVSRFQLAYSFFVITAFSVIGLFGIFLNLKDKKLVVFQSNTGIMIIVSQRISCILACGMGYMGALRMKNMINHINILEEIRNKINCDCNSAKEDQNVMWMSLFIIVSNVILTLVETMLTMMRTSEWNIGVILLAIHYLENNILIIIKILIVVINFEVYKVLMELNEKLRYIYTLANKGHLTTAKAQVINARVRCLTQCYFSVYEVVKKINNADGLFVFMIYLFFVLFSVFDGYGLVLTLNELYKTQCGWPDFLLQCAWCIMIIVRVFFFVEPYERISAQVAEMKVLLEQLMYVMTPMGNHVSVELDIMFKQVTLNVPKYCPLDIITLNRSLITVTLNAIITFLVYLVQLQL